MPPSRGPQVALVLLLYVLPLGAALVFLVSAELYVLAVGLAVVEVLMVAAVVWAKRTG